MQYIACVRYKISTSYNLCLVSLNFRIMDIYIFIMSAIEEIYIYIMSAMEDIYIYLYYVRNGRAS